MDRSRPRLIGWARRCPERSIAVTDRTDFLRRGRADWIARAKGISGWLLQKFRSCAGLDDQGGQRRWVSWLCRYGADTSGNWPALRIPQGRRLRSLGAATLAGPAADPGQGTSRMGDLAPTLARHPRQILGRPIAPAVAARLIASLDRTEAQLENAHRPAASIGAVIGQGQQPDGCRWHGAARLGHSARASALDHRRAAMAQTPARSRSGRSRYAADPNSLVLGSAAYALYRGVRPGGGRDCRSWRSSPRAG